MCVVILFSRCVVFSRLLFKLCKVTYRGKFHGSYIKFIRVDLLYLRGMYTRFVFCSSSLYQPSGGVKGYVFMKYCI